MHGYLLEYASKIQYSQVSPLMCGHAKPQVGILDVGSKLGEFAAVECVFHTLFPQVAQHS